MKPITHHHVVALPPHFHETRHFAEVVAVVRIPHDDECAARRRDSGAQRGAVAALLHANHTRAKLFCDIDGAVRRTVVSDDDLAAQSGRWKRLHGLFHAKRKRIRFV